MDFSRRRAISSALGFLLLGSSLAIGASYRTQNFIITAETRQLAQEVGDAAEQYRESLAVEWLGNPLPPWQQPCPITVELASGAGGATSFMFERGRPFGWRMSIQGSRERLLDSVLPHEVTHTIFATHFGRPLPRWADEGACTTVEHESERARQEQFLLQFLRASPPRSIPFNRMFRMTEYPHDILPLYAQGHSVARYLIQQGGKRKFVDYVGRGMQTDNWDNATDEFYGYRDLSELQVDWIGWVSKGSPMAGVQELASLGLGPQSARQNSGVMQVAAVSDDLPRAASIGSGDLTSATNPPSRQSLGSSGSWYAQQRNGSQPIADVVQAAAPAEIAAVPNPSGSIPSRDGTPSARWLPGSARLVSPTGFASGGGSIASTEQPASDSLSEMIPIPRSMARPQPTQQPQQTVLQWDQPPSVAVGPGVELRRSGVMEAGPRYDAPMRDVPALRR